MLQLLTSDVRAATIHPMPRMSLSRFCRIVREAVDSLPPEIAVYLDNVSIDVLDEPTDDHLRDAGFSDDEIAAGETLYGLFVPVEGIGTSDMDMLDTPNQIFVFKHPLEDDFDDPRELRIEIWKTVVHEIAHHFGFSEADLDRFEANPDPFGDVRRGKLCGPSTQVARSARPIRLAFSIPAVTTPGRSFGLTPVPDPGYTASSFTDEPTPAEPL